MDPITLTILIIILVAATVAIILLNGSKSQRAGQRDNARPQSFDSPSNSEDRSVPVVIGYRRVAPAVINWWGVERSPIVKVDEIETGGKDGGSETVEQVVGFAVFTRQLMAICEGPIDCIRGFFLDDEYVWAGFAYNGDTFEAQTGHPSGGESSSHHGPSPLICHSGASTSLPQYAASSGDPVPYYRTATFLADRAFVGDNAGNVPNWAVVVLARDAIFELNVPVNLDDGTKRKIGPDDVNPADVANYVLQWLMQIPASEIDLDSFRAAQTTFANEATGISVLIEANTSGDDILADIERHTDSHIFVSARTGLWTMRVVREDYDLETIPVLTTAHYSDLELSRQGVNDTFTDIKVSYISQRTWEPVPFRIQNDAGRRSINGVRSETIDFQWFVQPGPFWAAVARLKRRNFLPLAFARFNVPRDLRHPETGEPWIPEPGDVFRIDYTDPMAGGLTTSGLIFRVMLIEGNADESESLRIEAAQDIWSVSGITVETQNEGESTVPDLTLDEEIGALSIGDAIPEMTRIPSIVVLAGPPATKVADRYRVSINGRSRGNFAIVPFAELSAELAASASLFDRDGEFTVEAASSGVAAWTQSVGAWHRIGRFAILDQGDGTIEIVGVRNLVDNEDGSFTASGLVRGLAGTGNVTHAAGTRVWLPTETFFEFAARGGKIAVAGESLNVALSVTVTPENVRFSGPPTASSYTYGRRVETPYPVTELSLVEDGPDVVLSWSPRNRHSGWAATNGSIDAAPPYDATSEADHFEITDDAGSGAILAPADPPTYRVVGGNVGGREYTVRTGLRGYYSAGETVVVD